MRFFSYYIEIIDKFLTHQINFDNFKNLYFNRFLNEKNDMDEDLFSYLDWLFAETNSCTSNHELLQDNRYIDEKQLRVVAEKVLKAIQNSQ